MKRHASMNRIYRLVWSRVHEAWVAVAETARGRGKGSSRKLVAAALSLCAAIAQAAPSGGQISAGTGSISQSGATTTIRQSSQNLSLNWKSFNIAPAETVNFRQPDASAIAVNRIFDTNGTQILGHLNANGQVWLINPNGILFGQGAQVNVGGLVASTLDFNDSTLNGNARTFSGNGSGSVINRGTINAADSGYVALLGNHVSNQGAISARLGTVALAAGSAVTLSFDGNSLVKMQVDQSVLNSMAENGGLIRADGGMVVMNAGAKNALLASVVNNTGVIEARTVENREGVITLLGGMQGGQVNVGGTLDAGAPNGGKGGFIETSAASVKVANDARVTTAASMGLYGTWLIDPVDFTIAAGSAAQTTSGIGASTLSGNLGSGNIGIATSATTAGNGDIFVNAAVSWAANKLTLSAHRNIDINADLNGSGSASLALEYGQGAVAAGNTSNYNVRAPVNLPAGPNFSTKLGSNGAPVNYTVITSLGAAGDATTGPATLQGMAATANLAGNYALGSNIDAAATSTWNSTAGFVPIGNSTNNFTGAFDGLGHTIGNLAINRSSTDYIGLFGITGSGSAVRNAGLVGGSVKGGSYVGGLVGQNGGLVRNSYFTGSVTGGAYKTGGLVGTNYGTISNSYATGNVSGTLGVGGLVGTNLVTVENSYYTTGSVSGASYVGGLVGLNGGSVSNSYATGSVSGSDRVGGLVGHSYGSVSNSYATGSVSGSSYVGGLVGCNFSYGVFVGTVSNGHWNRDVNPIGIGGGAGTTTATTGLTTLEMQQQSNFSSWDFANTWIVYNGFTNPLLRSFMRPLTVSNAVKTYDGLTAGNSAFGIPASNISGTLSYGGTASGAVNAGSYTVTGPSGLYSNQQGYIISYADGTLTINQRAVTVTANAGQSKTYGNADPASFTYTNTSLGSGAALVGGLDRAAGENVGAYAIGQGTLTNANNTNYSLTYAGDNFGITQRAVTVTANAGQSKTYGNADPASFTYSNTSLGSGAALVGALDRAAGENVGAYAIGQGTLTNANNTNYSLTYAGDNFGITQRAVTVTASAGQSKTYGNADPASFSYTNTGLGSGAALVGALDRAAGENVGAYAIGQGTLTNANNTNYSLSYAGDNFGITQRAVTVTANAGQSKTYGNADPASFTYSNTSLGSGAALVGALDRAAGENVGAYAIGQGTLTNANNTNYSLSYAGDNFGIAQRAVTVTASAGQSKTYGNADPASFSYTNTGLGSGAALVGGLDRAAGENVGAYAIGQGTLTNANNTNYSLSYAGDNFNINQRAITLAADAASKTYGNADPALSVRITGGSLGSVSVSDTLAEVTGTVGRQAGETVAGGPYDITLGSGAKAGNYAITFAADNNAFSINQRAITLAADAASKIYGNADPALGVSITGGSLGSVSVSDTLAEVTGTVGRQAGETVAGGPYDITLGSGATAGNYAITFAADNNAFSINQRAVTVTASAGQNKTYGNADPASFAYTNTSLGSGAALVGALDRAAGENVGAYAIGQGTLTNANNTNYSLSYAGDNFGINQRAVIVTASAGQSKTYGNADPASFSYTNTGLGSGTALVGALDRAAGENVGAYAIGQGTLTNANNTNYSLSYAGDNFGITQRAVTVTANAGQSKTYGNAGPASFSYTNTGLGSGAALVGALDRAAGENVGAYAIGQGTLTNANNTNYSLTYAGDNFGITQRAVTVTANAGQSKTYGNADPASFTYSNTSLGSGAALVGALDRAAGENVGAYAIGQGTLTNANNTNYSLTYAGNNFGINQRAVIVTASAGQSKTYGNADPASFSYTNTGLGSGAALVGGLDRAAGENVGVYAIGQGTLTNANNTNYSLSYAGDNFNINQRAITLAADAASKTYGNADPALSVRITGGSLGSVSVSDTLAEVTGTVGRQTGERVAGGPYDITLGSGAKAGNYAITYAGGTLTVNPAALTVTGTTASNKAYDATTSATLTGGSLNGVISGDTVALTQAGTFASKNVGTGIAVTATDVLGGADAGNYIVVQPSGLTANITKADLAVTGVTASNKVYDASTAATLGGTATIAALGADVVNLGGTGSGVFADKYVGTAKPVTVSGFTLSGADADNYSVVQPTGLTANITAAKLAVTGVTASNKVYDATTAATLGGAATIAAVGADVVNLGGSGTGVFADKNVGTGKAVTVSGFTLSGADANNYSVVQPAGVTANITPANLAVTGVSASNRVYDATTAATLAGTAAVTAIGTDSVSVGGIGRGVFADENAGTGKTVAVSGFTLAGTDAGNYVVVQPAGLTASITTATLYYQATPANFIAGQTPSGLSGTVVGYAPGDNVADSTSGSMAWTTSAGAGSPPGQYPIDGGGLVSTNYVLVQAAANATALTLNVGTSAIGITAVLQPILDELNGGRALPENNPRIVVDTLLTSGGAMLPVQIVNGGIRMPDGFTNPD